MSPLRSWISAKIHGIRVTGASVEYHGSVSICPDLMEAAEIHEGEQVHIVNLATGDRWITYAIRGDEGAFTLNGGSARLGEIGDPCVIMTYAWAKTSPGAAVIFVDKDNDIIDRMRYRP